jgi:hypothetical protein
MGLAMQKIFPYLTYAGAIPFVLCALCLLIGVEQIPMLGSIEQVLSVYALVISTFLTGVHWGQHLHIHEDRWGLILPIVSNILAVALWIGFLVLGFHTLVIMFVVAFSVLLIIDHQLYRADIISHHYFQTRLIVSSIVIISLILSGVFS